MTREEFIKQTMRDWKSFEHLLFGEDGPPKRKTWTGILNISTLLMLLGDSLIRTGYVHMFFPQAGSDDFRSSAICGVDRGCLLLNDIRVVKPRALHFASFGDPAWNYFWLELAPLEPSAVYPDLSSTSPDLQFEEVSLIDGVYHNRSHIDYGIGPDDNPISSDAALRIRYFGGNFLFTCKGGHYNLRTCGVEADVHGGFHNTMSPDAFHNYIEKLALKS